MRSDCRRLRQQLRSKWERCWIAELNGENVGTVMLVKDSPGVARLRLLLVDPKARGLGLAREACRRMRALCAQGRLQENHTVDAQHSDRRAARL